MQLIDGKATAAAIKEQIAQEVKEIIAKGGKQPHLVAVLVGHDDLREKQGLGVREVRVQIHPHPL